MCNQTHYFPQVCALLVHWGGFCAFLLQHQLDTLFPQLAIVQHRLFLCFSFSLCFYFFCVFVVFSMWWDFVGHFPLFTTDRGLLRLLSSSFPSASWCFCFVFELVLSSLISFQGVNEWSTPLHLGWDEIARGPPDPIIGLSIRILTNCSRIHPGFHFVLNL